MTKQESDRRYRERNRDKIKAARKQYREANKEKIRAYNVKRYQETRYQKCLATSRVDALKKGCLPCYASVEEIASADVGVCHACGVPEVECSRRLHIDHCHETGSFRGWLCHNCNLALGQAKDSEERLKRLIRYLERGEASQQPQQSQGSNA